MPASRRPPPPTVLPSDLAILHGLQLIPPADIPRVESWVLNNCDWSAALHDRSMPFDPDEQLLPRLVNDSVTTGCDYDRKSVCLRGLKGELVELVGDLEQALLERFEMAEIQRSLSTDAAQLNRLAREAEEVVGRMEAKQRMLVDEGPWAEKRTQHLEIRRRRIRRGLERARKGSFKAAWDSIPSLLQWGTRDGAALSLVHGRAFQPPREFVSPLVSICANLSRQYA